jgi:DNA-binding response OmpR family regulator
MNKRKLTLLSHDDIVISNLKGALKMSDFSYEIISNKNDAIVRNLLTSDVLIIDDLNPLQISALELCKQIRNHNKEIVIILVSETIDKTSKIVALELEADDLLEKPVNHLEIFARIKISFKRMGLIDDHPLNNNIITVGNLQFDLDYRNCTVDNSDLTLTKNEFTLLFHLVKNKNNSFTREELMQDLWGQDYLGTTRTIDDLVMKLRKKLGKANSNVTIATIWGYGYRIDVPEKSTLYSNKLNICS